MTTKCPVCTANYNPITCLEECPHRLKSHVVLDGGSCPSEATELEEVQAIEWMGLRHVPTDEQMRNRFSYHKPKPGQTEDYQAIRDQARDLAAILVHRCPPSPELASALDHLDTVVFKANASIARHG